MKKLRFNLKDLKAADIELLAKFCERIHYTNSGEPFSNHVYVVMQQAFSGNHFSLDRFTVNPLVHRESLNESVPGELLPVYQTYMHQHPGLGRIGDSQQTDASSIRTELTESYFHNCELYNEFYRLVEVEDQMWMSVGDGREWIGFSFSRDTLFSEKEITILSLINPHMRIAWQNWKRIRELEQKVQMLEDKNVFSEETEALARSARELMDRLTSRQRDIAELVAQGLENRKIAETLHIAPKTVNKHLENIFLTLDIHHRAALAAKWQQAKAQN